MSADFPAHAGTVRRYQLVFLVWLGRHESRRHDEERIAATLDALTMR
jgi:hypothetical protein